MAGVFGILGEMLFGVSLGDSLVMYVLPIMGGGTGGGIVLIIASLVFHNLL